VNAPLKDQLTVEIANEQSACTVDESLIRQAVLEILAGESVTAGQISVALVDDPTIHEINRRHLQHDYPTDVISFVLDCEEGYLDGEVVASADTACSVAKDLDWPAQNELLLYVVHGTLHLVGYDDQADSDRDEMRTRERHYLARFGLVPPWQAADE
jgi:probable rRNA maturation factor